MDVKEFLEQEDIKALIANNDLEAVYDKYQPLHNRKDLSEYLIDRGINPLDYFKNSIPAAAFWGCKVLTSANILDSVTKISAAAFPFCTNLLDVKIGNNVVDIGSEAFISCTDLTSIYIPSSVIDIGPHAFLNCGNLTSVTIDENSQLTSISNGAFSKCINLTNITIPSSVTNIGSFAFESCTSLMDIYYMGTKEQWEKINIDPRWRFNSSISTIICTDSYFVLEF